jgi:DtxR family transcriptional regulator, Mn-dependent transcriptional regulator
MTRPTPTIEDYLTILFVLDRDHEKAIPARLAEALEVTPPTVTVTLKRMERDGLITHPDRQGIHLTETGQEAARSVMRRHMLMEWMLRSMLNVPWSRLHVEAHKIEHSISDEIEARLSESLHAPQTCPHGNPLPGYEHIIAGWLPLSQALPGQKLVIRRVHEMAENRTSLLAFLEDNGIVPGAPVELCEVLPFNQTLTLQVEGRLVSLGLPVARYIYAEKVACPTV